MSVHVVFEYIKGPSTGVRTWTTYDSRKAFDTSWKKRDKKEVMKK